MAIDGTMLDVAYSTAGAPRGQPCGRARYQLTPAARAGAAGTAGLDPGRISYTITLCAIRRALTSTSASRAEALTCLLPPHRRHRSYPRHMPAGTARRRKARTTLTGTITVNTPAPEA